MSLRPRILLCVSGDWEPSGLQLILGAADTRDVAVVPDAKGMLAELRSRPVTVAVLGWPFAGLEAGAFFEAFKGIAPHPPLVVLHAPEEASEVARWQPAGISSLLVRSGEWEPALARTVQSLVESWQLRGRLAQSEAQYTELLQNTRDAIYILGPSRFTFVNRAFEELLGYGAEEICSPSFDYMRMIAPESRPMILERARLAALGEPLPPRYEFMALNRAGQRLDVAVSVSYIIYDAQPSSLGVLQDITARKQYEKALLRRNRELAVLNDLAATVSRAPDLSTVLEMAVERLIAVMGFNAAGISLLGPEGDTVSARLYRGINKEQLGALSEVPLGVGLIGQAARTGDVQVVHDLTTDQRMVGQELQVLGFKSAVCVPIQAKDRVLGSAIGLCVDVRDFAPEELSLLLSIGHQLGTAVERASLYDHREIAMQRMLALDEVARALASTLDDREVFKVAAEQVERVLKSDSLELALLRREVQHPHELEVVLHTARGRNLHPGRTISEDIGLLWRGLSSEAPVRLDATDPLSAAELAVEGVGAVVIAPLLLDGQAIGAIKVGFAGGRARADQALEFIGSVSRHLALAARNSRMFSDLEKAYRELKETQDKLVLQEKLGALGEMSAGVAHDFNNVLGAILGRTQLLKTFISDTNLLKSLEVIERAALDGAATVKRIQEFSRVGGDEDFTPVDLDEVAEAAAEMTQARWKDRARAEGVTIEVVVDKGMPPRVRGNAQQLREVLTNLIHNACDAMPQGGRVSVSTGLSGERCFIRIADSGTGIPPEVQSRVFDPFFTTKGVKGTGLGLSVSYGIVQRHRGELELQSELGCGTTFTIWLDPLEKKAENGARVLEAVLPVAKVVGARVLVIDDEESIRDVLADMLRAADHFVETAPDGPTGLERLEALLVDGLDVVFTDLGMPGMSGWEVAMAVKERHPNLPVGLITGWGATLDMDKMRSHGVDLVVPKPFRFEQVTSVVAEAIELARGRRD